MGTTVPILSGIQVTDSFSGEFDDRENIDKVVWSARRGKYLVEQKEPIATP